VGQSAPATAQCCRNSLVPFRNSLGEHLCNDRIRVALAGIILAGFEELLRDLIVETNKNAWPKFTGGKGVHVMVSIARGMTHDQAHAYCKRLAERLAATAPDRFTTSAALAKRPGRLFIDYLRNGRGTTAIGTYSPRASLGFPIAAPVTWTQLERGIRPDTFHMS
jgi:bifunctional non-homologous end joining protein LigD